MNRKKLIVIVLAVVSVLTLNPPLLSMAEEPDASGQEIGWGWEENEEEYLTGTAKEDTPAAEQANEELLRGTADLPKTSDAAIQEALEKAETYLANTVTNPAVNTECGEWSVLAMARYGVLVGSTRSNYLSNLIKTLDQNNGVLDSRKYTEYSRVVLAMSSMGIDPSDVNGYNLLAPLADLNQVNWQGINGTIFALLALDSHQYEIPDLTDEQLAEGKVQTTRDALINEILSKEISGGGWSLSGKNADADMTAMALQALAPYRNNGKVKPYIDRGLVKLAQMQNADGGFGSSVSGESGGTLESAAQVVTALSALGIDPLHDDQFIKNGKTILDALLSLQIADGSFQHTAGGGGNGIATDQGTCALVAWHRAVNGMKSFYDMTDVTMNPQEEESAETVAKFKGKVAALPEQITLDQKAEVYALKAELVQMKRFDEKSDLLKKLNGFTAQISRLEKGIIAKEVFEWVVREKADYLYKGEGYSLKLKGQNTYTPADMWAGLTIKNTKTRLSFTTKAEGVLPGEVEVTVKDCKLPDGVYMLYQVKDGKEKAVQWTGVFDGKMSCDIVTGGEYILKKVVTAEEKSSDKTAPSEKTSPASSASSGRGGASQGGASQKASNTVKAEVKNGIVEKSAFEGIKDTDLNLRIEGMLAEDRPYALTINGKDVKNARDFRPGIKEGSTFDEEIGKLASDAYSFHFEETGEFPGKFLVEMTVNCKDGEYLLLRYDDKEGKAQYIQKVEVKDKKTKFLVSEGGTYFIAKKVSTKSVAEIEQEEAQNHAEAVSTDADLLLAGTKDVNNHMKTIAAVIAAAIVLLVSAVLWKKKKAGVLLLVFLLAMTSVGCSSKQSKAPEDSAKSNEEWMQEEQDNKDDQTESDFMDVESVDDEAIDYSKYEEKEGSVKGVTYSDGNGSKKDEYQTGPVSAGRQNPVEPGSIQIDKSKTYSCYMTISCANILDNMNDLTAGKESLVPKDGVIYSRRKVSFNPGESVFDILQRETRKNRIHMEYRSTPMYNSAYIEGIHNLYEFDCGPRSGWMYCVNGWYPNYGCSRYVVQNGDEIQWNYTCDLGADNGQGWMK